MSRLRTPLAVAGAALLAVSLLSGCSAISKVAGASTKIADCRTVSKAITKDSSDLTEGVSKVSTDPSAASAAIKTYAGKLHDLVDEVKDGGVKKAVSTAADKADAMSAAFDAYAADPQNSDISAVSTSASDAQTAIADLAKVCTKL